MRKTLYAVTHGKKRGGPNPELDPSGAATILALADRIPVSKIKSVLVGTGARFVHTHRVLAKSESLKDLLKDMSISLQYSPLLGSADSGKKGESGAWDVILADGTEIRAGGYIGLSEAAGINLWEFLGSLPDGTLLVTGRELIIALGIEEAQSATIYEIGMSYFEGKMVSNSVSPV